MADLRALRRLGEYGVVAAAREFPKPLWRLQRKEPGCVVGAHRQVRFCCICWPLCFFTPFEPPPVRGATERDRFGEMDRSKENRTDEAEEGPHRLTRVGEVEPRKKVEEREEKLKLVEDAKAEEEELLSRGEGERDRSTEPVLDFLEDAAIFLLREERKRRKKEERGEGCVCVCVFFSFLKAGFGSLVWQT